MKIAILFSSRRGGWDHADHEARMEVELAPDFGKEPEAEYEVAHALRARGHEVWLLGCWEDPGYVTRFLKEHPVDIVFNTAEGFCKRDELDLLPPALLEAVGQPYTGAPPQGLVLSRNKEVTKEILAHRGVRVPRFKVYRRGDEVGEAVDVPFPAIVKPLRTDASIGIAKASIVRDRAEVAERVAYVHEKVKDAAIVEEYIEGRELYVATLGNGAQLQMLPIVELLFDAAHRRPEERIATKFVKWRNAYREKNGIRTVFAEDVSPAAQASIERACRIAFDALWLRDYARFDIRLDAQDNAFILEGNANPYIGREHEVADAAARAGIDYPALLEKIVEHALARRGAAT